MILIMIIRMVMVMMMMTLIEDDDDYDDYGNGDNQEKPVDKRASKLFLKGCDRCLLMVS